MRVVYTTLEDPNYEQSIAFPGGMQAILHEDRISLVFGPTEEEIKLGRASGVICNVHSYFLFKDETETEKSS